MAKFTAGQAPSSHLGQVLRGSGGGGGGGGRRQGLRFRCSPVQEDAADVVVRDGGFLGAGGHPQRAQEVVHQDVQLLHVLGLGLQHAEHHLVPLAHAVRVRRPDVVLDDGLPLAPAQPAPQEALHLGAETGGRAAHQPTLHLLRCC